MSTDAQIRLGRDRLFGSVEWTCEGAVFRPEAALLSEGFTQLFGRADQLTPDLPVVLELDDAAKTRISTRVVGQSPLLRGYTLAIADDVGQPS